MLEPTGIYLVQHYLYDGCGRHDQDAVTFEFSYPKARKHIEDIYNDSEDYHWEHDPKTDDDILIRREGQYGYDYYYIQFAAPGEEID